ncbi:double-strand break repair protein AddB [Palleronia caenipelagi]|uniref:double-strand break repair protein AddB n=1 Tax=Palleronia caenipelagi TaxID=2489174 RepID=UPI00163D4AB0|nr:double-strand break repair protein AddB [Palleronia caenipelagi]
MPDAPLPNLFALPVGADFTTEVVRGLESRLGDDPLLWARSTIYVNSARMERRLREKLAEGPARLLPRMQVVTHLADHPLTRDLPRAPSAVRRRLELAELVRKLIEQDPTLAPRSHAFALADTLIELFEEMEAEGIDPDALSALDVSNESGHWQRALRFLTIADNFAARDDVPGQNTRLRQAALTLAAHWSGSPPADPVFVIGSTGSRRPVTLLMEAVARMPNGAVILPGLDLDLPAPVWRSLTAEPPQEDHPQFLLADLIRRLGMTPDEVRCWTDARPRRARAAMVSMALRPAPVTDQWMRDGPELGDLIAATEGLDLIEAADPAEEAQAVALRLRRALDEGLNAALITADRTLARRVEAAVDRWGLVVDDSAGAPLHLTAPGRLLRMLARIMGQALAPEPLLSMLKHPLVAAPDRRLHLERVRALEIWLRGRPLPAVTPRDLSEWADQAELPEHDLWLLWVQTLTSEIPVIAAAPLSDLLNAHLTLANRLSGGPTGDGADLWKGDDGQKAAEALAALTAEADATPQIELVDFAALIDTHFAGEQALTQRKDSSGIVIWGRTDARMQGADLIVLAGLNDGVWPETGDQDPWLNRAMRRALGLPSPERRIGLSAHDFQQAMGAPRVVLTRARRDAEAETVASRWLNRMTTLLEGLPGQNGPEALAAMRTRGSDWLRLARGLIDEQDVSPLAFRPSPQPPVALRPNQLSVTRIQTLIRDPYAIYAERILRLKPLDPLQVLPDARLRGILIHEILKSWIDVLPEPADAETALTALRETAETYLAQLPWAITRVQWAAFLEQSAGTLIPDELSRQSEADPLVREVKGRLELSDPPFTLTGTADRIDRRPDGELLIYDYKTGKLPTADQMTYFDKQLVLEAAMAERGAFEGVAAAPVHGVSHIGLGPKGGAVQHPLRVDDPKGKKPTLDPDIAVAELCGLLRCYARPEQGYTALRAIETTGAYAHYAHLARYGEWDLSDEPVAERVE